MLELTDNAASLIVAIAEKQDLPQGAGLRIAPTIDGSAEMTAKAATAPRSGDRIVERGGARVFLTPPAADALDDKVLDAQVDDRGMVGFFIAPRPSGTP